MKDERPSVSEPAPRREPGEEPAEGVEQLRRELDEKHDRYLRALADVENVKRRAQRERDEYLRYANESLIRDLLPVLDNFDRALDAARQRGEAASMIAGIELIQRELMKVLEKFGLERYSALGATFDPARHEAVSRVMSSTEPENTVVGETARGYLLHGRVLRPALVAVAVAPGGDA
jgi:molecular chaperone GrpE